MTALLEISGIEKSFSGVRVLKGVGFTLAAGETLGLVGENGAGKSTLMNVLGGVFPPDAGSMTVAGHPYAPAGPLDAARRGTAFVHQELNLFGTLSVAENIYLPEFPKRFGLVDRARMRERTRELFQELERDIDPDCPVESLSPGERQLLEIAKALNADARVIIFDEPTTSLSADDSEKLFRIIARLKARGIAIIYISHALEDVLRLADSILILRDGEAVGSGPVAGFPVDRLISLMVGRPIQQLFPPRDTTPSAEPALVVDAVSRPGVVHDIRFKLQRGEVLGLAGLMGAGRSELARILFGLDEATSGRVLLGDRDVTKLPPAERIAAGLALLTESRQADGLLLDAPIIPNLGLAALPRWIRRGTVADAGLRREANEVASAVRLACASMTHQPVRSLSGGNQQKVVLGKWLLTNPKVLILDEPTRGIDVGAKYEVYRVINELAARGAGILVISSEIEELLGIADRILVMSRGEVTGEFPRERFHREAILSAAFSKAGAR